MSPEREGKLKALREAMRLVERHDVTLVLGTSIPKEQGFEVKGKLSGPFTSTEKILSELIDLHLRNRP